MLCELGDAVQCEELLRQAAGLTPSASSSSSPSFSFSSSPSSSSSPHPSSSSSSLSIWPTIALAHFYLYVRGDSRSSTQLLKRTIELRNKRDTRNLPTFSYAEKLQILNSKNFKHTRNFVNEKSSNINNMNYRGNKYNSELLNNDNIDDLDSSDENIPDLTQGRSPDEGLEDFER